MLETVIIALIVCLGIALVARSAYKSTVGAKSRCSWGDNCCSDGCASMKARDCVPK
jgi:hypothetical protein